MQGLHFLLLDRSRQPTEIVAQGVVLRQINKDGTHFLCKSFKKGYSFNEVVPVERLESAILFESAQDMDKWVAEATQPQQPPVDNAHVAQGCQQFAPAEPNTAQEGQS